jgi:glycosyltransferase involved in cell wall biosynthesis
VIRPGRLIIADPGLTGPLGHHLGYSAAVAGAALAEGMPAVVLAGHGFAGTFPVAGVDTHAVLVTAYQTAGGGELGRRLVFGLASHLPAPLAGLVAPPLRHLRRMMRTAARPADGLGPELARELGRLGAGAADLLLLHSVSSANLYTLAVTEALPEVTLLLVLRRMPAEMEADDPAPESMVALLHRMATRFGPRLRLFADTESLAGQFRDLAGLPVRPVPLPVIVPDRRQAPPVGLPHVVFAGGARLEKGYQHLPAALAAVSGRARFTIQSGAVGPQDDPLVQRAHRALLAQRGAEVTIIEHPLEPHAYAELLYSADLLLLPYDGATYGARSSGILAEALALGLPAVVPAGCWMAEVAAPDRAVAFAPGSPPGLALATALDQLPALSRSAQAAAPAWRAKHNPAALFRALTTAN